METKTENTAPEIVTRNIEEKTLDELSARIQRFRTSTAVFRTMVKNGIMTEADYIKCCDVLADKYGLSLCSIFR